MKTFNMDSAVFKTKTILQQIRQSESYAQRNTKKLHSMDTRFAFFRLISTIVFLALLLGQKNIQSALIFIPSILIFLLYCLVLASIHQRIQKKRHYWQALVTSYQLSLARIQRDFSFIQTHKQLWHDNIVYSLPENHPYAFDLDIHTQLFSLFNTCTTEQGSEKLFSLLIKSGIFPESENILQQRIIHAERLSISTSLVRRFESLRLTESFIKTLHSKNIHLQKTIQNPFSVFWIISKYFYIIIAIFIWIILLVPAYPHFMLTKDIKTFTEPIIIYTFILLLGVSLFNREVLQAQELTRHAKIFKEIIFRLKSSKLRKDIGFSFLNKNNKNSLVYLNFFVDLISLRANPIFWILIHVFLPFDAIVLLGVSYFKSKISKKIPIWHHELIDLDISMSFARLLIENPTFQYPKKHEKQKNSWVFEKMGHPLLAATKCIYNSMLVQQQNPVTLLTGSNMAGKSTFLRSIGTNILLANIGAPICAEVFEFPISKLFCAIRINDSLSEGTSYFYSEVKRIKSILDSLDLKDGYLKIFLIDEIFKGTNNRERFIGSYYIIKALFEKNAFGFISTHDLALTEIEQEDSRLKNMHFREHIEENKLIFDYLIKEGPCPTSNALFIMKKEGLPIPKDV